MPRPAEVSPALRNYGITPAARRKQSRTGRYFGVTQVAAPNPRGEWQLLREFGCRQRVKFGSQKFRVSRGYTKDDQRSCVAEDGCAYGLGDLFGVLIRETKVRRKLASLTEDRGECVGRKRLEFVDMDKMRDALVRRD